MRHSAILPPFVLLSLVACAGEKPDDTGSKDTGDENAWAQCTQVEASVAPDEVVPTLGGSAADLSVGLSGLFMTEGAWVADGTPVGISLGVTLGDTVVFVDQEPNTGGGSDTGPQPAIEELDTGGSLADCPDYLLISGAFTFATDDGAFNEAFSGNLVVYAVGEGSLNGEIALADLQGSWSDPEFNPADWDEVAVRVGAVVRDDTTTSGTTSAFASKVEEGDDGVAMATMSDLVAWNRSEEM